jgi:hypothetical protein
MRNESPERLSIDDALSGRDTNQEGKGISQLRSSDPFPNHSVYDVTAVDFVRQKQ